MKAYILIVVSCFTVTSSASEKDATIATVKGSVSWNPLGLLVEGKWVSVPNVCAQRGRRGEVARFAVSYDKNKFSGLKSCDEGEYTFDVKDSTLCASNDKSSPYVAPELVKFECSKLGKPLPNSQGNNPAAQSDVKR